MAPTPTFWAYLAGVIEGEGTIGASASVEHKPSLRLVISNTSHEWLAWIQTQVGGDLTMARARSRAHKPLCQLNFRVAEMGQILPKIQPYLQLKTAQCALALQYLTLPRGDPGRREIVAQLVRLNRKGPSTDIPVIPRTWIPHPRTCKECGQGFTAYRRDRWYCSVRCYQRRYQRELKRRQGARPRSPDKHGYT